MSDPVPVLPDEPIVRHTEPAEFEPSNDFKTLSNMQPGVWQGDVPPAAVKDEEGNDIDPNLLIEQQNLTPQTEWPQGDNEQTPGPEWWREKTMTEREAEYDQNVENSKRNMTPEAIVGTISAEEGAPVENEVPPPEPPPPSPPEE